MYTSLLSFLCVNYKPRTRPVSFLSNKQQPFQTTRQKWWRLFPFFWTKEENNDAIPRISFDFTIKWSQVSSVQHSSSRDKTWLLGSLQVYFLYLASCTYLAPADCFTLERLVSISYKFLDAQISCSLRDPSVFFLVLQAPLVCFKITGTIRTEFSSSLFALLVRFDTVSFLGFPSFVSGTLLLDRYLFQSVLFDFIYYNRIPTPSRLKQFRSAGSLQP